jgi:hypothetical protein
MYVRFPADDGGVLGAQADSNRPRHSAKTLYKEKERNLYRSSSIVIVKSRWLRNSRHAAGWARQKYISFTQNFVTKHVAKFSFEMSRKLQVLLILILCCNDISPAGSLSCPVSGFDISGIESSGEVVTYFTVVIYIFWRFVRREYVNTNDVSLKPFLRSSNI